MGTKINFRAVWLDSLNVPVQKIYYATAFQIYEVSTSSATIRWVHAGNQQWAEYMLVNNYLVILQW